MDTSIFMDKARIPDDIMLIEVFGNLRADGWKTGIVFFKSTLNRLRMESPGKELWLELPGKRIKGGLSFICSQELNVFLWPLFLVRKQQMKHC